MAVPYTFGSATTSIPLSQLDSNFATTITLGNTAIQLGNTVTTLNNMTLANATVSSGNITVLNATVTNDASISGLTVGKGGGSQLNTVVGYQAGQSNTTGNISVYVGYQAGATNTTGGENAAVGYKALFANTTGNYNNAFGGECLIANTTGGNNNAYGTNTLQANTVGSNNSAFGQGALASNTTASNNTAVGYQAGYSNTTGAYNTLIGQTSGFAVTTGTQNTFIGAGSGSQITTGNYNSILGFYNGNQGGLDIRTSNNYIVLSDGVGNPRMYYDSANSVWNIAGGRTVIGNAFVADNISNGNNRGIAFGSAGLLPTNGSGTLTDNTYDLGSASFRWRTVYAGTGTINTSDANQKQQIRSLDDAEKAVAQSIKGLIKAFKFNDSVAEKGDGARIHVGVIAQDIAKAFADNGLDASKYGMFCSDTWYEVNGKSIDENMKNYTKDTLSAVAKTRLGVRYEELLAFVIATL